jgi:IS5 family transposase
MHKRPPSFFDVEIQLDKIYQLNDFLPKLNSLIDWELFRPDLNKVREKERLSNAGRKPFDVMLMFKILVLKSLYNLADERIEEQIRDRLSFLGLNFSDIVPDAKTILFFAEQLKDLSLERVLFDRFNEERCRQGCQTKSGNPLTEDQKATNRVKSGVRCRVEHVFGAMKMRMGDEVLRSIGLERAALWFTIWVDLRV